MSCGYGLSALEQVCARARSGVLFGGVEGGVYVFGCVEPLAVMRCVMRCNVCHPR